MPGEAETANKVYFYKEYMLFRGEGKAVWVIRPWTMPWQLRLINSHSHAALHWPSHTHCLPLILFP